MTQLFSEMVHHYAVYSCWWYSFILKQCYWSLNKPKLSQQYWKKWKLSINPKKIKIMIFEKPSQINAWEIFLFLIDNDPIAIWQDYSWPIKDFPFVLMVTSQIKNEYWLKNVDSVFWQQKIFFTIKIISWYLQQTF